MSSNTYNETWNEVENTDIIDRITASMIGTEENNFELDKCYKTSDALNSNRFHYIVRLFAGRNGSGEWSSYLSDLQKIFENLIHERHFSDVWLIEWVNSCANDTSRILFGLRDDSH